MRTARARRTRLAVSVLPCSGSGSPIAVGLQHLTQPAHAALGPGRRRSRRICAGSFTDIVDAGPGDGRQRLGSALAVAGRRDARCRLRRRACRHSAWRRLGACPRASAAARRERKTAADAAPGRTTIGPGGHRLIGSRRGCTRCGRRRACRCCTAAEHHPPQFFETAVGIRHRRGCRWRWRWRQRHPRRRSAGVPPAASLLPSRFLHRVVVGPWPVVGRRAN